MADFNLFYPRLHMAEGGTADNPKDVGGFTYCGVAYNYWPKWAGWPTVFAALAALKLPDPRIKPRRYLSKKQCELVDAYLKPNKELAEQVKRMAKVNFWNPLQLDFVKSQSIANQLCDYGFNAGSSRPGFLIQYCLNTYFQQALRYDGDIGPSTVGAINEVDAEMLFGTYVLLRKHAYYFRAGKSIADVTVKGRRPTVEEVTAWRTFFGTKAYMNIKPNASQVAHLNSWISRCNEKFVS